MGVIINFKVSGSYHHVERVTHSLGYNYVRLSAYPMKNRLKRPQIAEILLPIKQSGTTDLFLLS